MEYKVLPPNPFEDSHLHSLNSCTCSCEESCWLQCSTFLQDIVSLRINESVPWNTYTPILWWNMGDLGRFLPSQDGLDRHHNKRTLKIPMIQGALMDEWANENPWTSCATVRTNTLIQLKPLLNIFSSKLLQDIFKPRQENKTVYKRGWQPG